MTTEASTNNPHVALTITTPAYLVPLGNSDAETMTPEEQAEFERALRRVANFPRELGWLMIYVGVLGVVLPGIIGFPLVIAGGAVVMPGGRKWLSRWVGRNPGRLTRASLKQITRMADDIERRYPSTPGASH